MSTRNVSRALIVLSGCALVGLSGSTVFAQDGAAIYGAKCASCHGADGKAETAVAKAMSVPALASPEVQKMSVDDIVAHIKEAAKHPAGVKSLSDADAKAVAEAVKKLGSGN